GTSVLRPQRTPALVPKFVLDLMKYQPPVEGRKIAGSIFPSPSKSPLTGVSVLSPHMRPLPLVKLVLDFIEYHQPLAGRYRVGSAFPSPSASPTIGIRGGGPCATMLAGEMSAPAIATAMPAQAKTVGTRILVNIGTFLICEPCRRKARA